MKICGLWVDIQEVHGPFWKVMEMKELTDLIYNEKFRGPSGLQQGEGGHGELDGLLTGARAAARWPGDGGEWWWQSMCR
jgi:hypothetical protein